MDSLISFVLNAAFLVSILSLVALGLGVIYGLLGVINMAHGELIAIGAYTVVVLTELGLPYWTALAVAPAVGMVLGMLLEATLIRRLTDRPLDAILVTVGLSLVLQQTLKAWFGATARSVPSPINGTFDLLGVSYPLFRVMIIVVATAIMALTFVFFVKSSFGLVVQAIFQNREAAVTNGVNAGKYNRIAFGLGTALAAFAGSLLAPSAAVLPQMGAFYLGPAFIAVILGGEKRLLGAVAGAAFMGGLEVFIGDTFTRTWGRVGVLILAIIVIRMWPGGLVREPKARVA